MSVILGDFSCFQKYCLLSLTRIVDFGHSRFDLSVLPVRAKKPIAKKPWNFLSPFLFRQPIFDLATFEYAKCVSEAI